MIVYTERFGSLFDWTVLDAFGLERLRGYRFDSIASINEHLSLFADEETIQFLIKSNFK